MKTMGDNWTTTTRTTRSLRARLTMVASRDDEAIAGCSLYNEHCEVGRMNLPVSSTQRHRELS